MNFNGFFKQFFFRFSFVVIGNTAVNRTNFLAGLFTMEPYTAISEGEDFYEIESDLCTECVGFHGEEACQEVCPVDCCIPDEDKKETEEELLEKAIKIHPDDTFPPIDDLTNETSLFRNPERKNASL